MQPSNQRDQREEEEKKPSSESADNLGGNLNLSAATMTAQPLVPNLGFTSLLPTGAGANQAPSAAAAASGNPAMFAAAQLGVNSNLSGRFAGIAAGHSGGAEEDDQKLGTTDTKPHPFDNMEGVDLPEYVKTHDTHLTFPEKLMLMLMHIEQEFVSKGKDVKDAPISWAMQGKAFTIRDREELIKHWLPKFFRVAKFPSFTRKLYRWGFRQISTPRGFDASDDRELFFFNPNFQRDDKNLMSRMSSVTAETKRQQQRREASGETETAAPLTLAQYPFAETKEQQEFSSAAPASDQVTLPPAQQRSAGMALNNQTTLNNALASQLSTPQGLESMQPQTAALNLAAAAGGSPSLAVHPGVFSQMLPSAAAAVNNPSSASRQLSPLELQILNLQQQQQQQQQQLTLSLPQQRNPPPPPQVPPVPMPSDLASSLGGLPHQSESSLSGVLASSLLLQQQQQLPQSQIGDPLTELVLRYGASGLSSLQQQQQQQPPQQQQHPPPPAGPQPPPGPLPPPM